VVLAQAAVDIVVDFLFSGREKNQFSIGNSLAPAHYALGRATHLSFIREVRGCGCAAI